MQATETKTVKLTVITNIESKPTGPVLHAEQIELAADAVISRKSLPNIDLNKFLRK